MNNNVLEFVIKAKDEASETLKSFASQAQDIGKKMAVAGGVITGALGLAVRAAADGEAQMAQFNNTIKNTKGSTDAAREALLKAADATKDFGFDNDDSAQAMARFYQRTGDVNQAIKLNSIAMDLARNKNIGLSEAANLVGQVLSGNGKVLKQYGIDIKETASPLEALDQLHQATKGSSEAFANTFEGNMEKLKLQAGDLFKTIGTQLLPIVTEFVGYLTEVSKRILKWTEAHPELTKAIVIIVGVIGGLAFVLGTLMAILTPVIAAFTFLLSPVGLVILAVVALTAAAVALYLRWDIAKQKILNIWEGIKEGIKAAVDWIMDKLQPMIDALDRVANAAGRVFSAVGGAVKSAGSAIGGAISSAYNYVTGARAGGGSVMGGSSYLVGENGAEIFTPGTRGYITPNNGVGGGSIVVNINGGTYLSKEVARDIGDMIIDNFRKVARFGI